MWSLKTILLIISIEALLFEPILYEIINLLNTQTFTQFDNESRELLNNLITSFLEGCVVLCFTYFVLKRRNLSKTICLTTNEVKLKSLSQFLLLGIGANAIISITIIILQSIYAIEPIPPASIVLTHWSAIFVVSLLIYGLLWPIIEELVFRGILFQALLRRFSMIPTVIINMLIFTILHDSIPSILHAIGVLITGFIACSIIIKTRSLLNAIVFHSAWNLTGIVLLHLNMK